MLYLPRRLRRFVEEYCDEHGIETGKAKWRLYVDIIREWAKKQGFKCPHRFRDDQSFFEINGEEYKRCLWCGEPVPRRVAEGMSRIDYSRLYPNLEDLK
jgi:hypothetical protein